MKQAFVAAVLTHQAILCSAFCQSFDSAEITKKVSPAVVLVTGVNDEGKWFGSGFVLSSEGKIATNLHVIQGLRSGGVQLSSGEKFDSFSVLAFDDRKDIAIIKIAGFDLPTVTLGNSNSIQVGEPVLVMGSPLGLQGSVTKGVISSMRDDLVGGGFKMIQTDASVNPGNSGGPLVNQKGEVVGIIRYKISGMENLNFAIPINYLRGMMDGSLTPMSLDDLRAKLAGKTDVFQKDEGFPVRWKSLSSGTTKILRRDGEHIYVETVMPEAAKQAGCFTIADLQKLGDTYSGKVKQSCFCQYQKRNWGVQGIPLQTKMRPYQHESPMQITSITPTRIEGWSMEPDPTGKYDCEKDTFSKPPTRQAFTWIPQ